MQNPFYRIKQGQMPIGRDSQGLSLLTQVKISVQKRLILPEHHVPHSEEVHVLPPELLVLLHVVLDQLH